MARILGVEVPDEKRVEIALTYIHGIGHKSAQDIIKAANIKPETRIKDLKSDKIQTITSVIENTYKVEGELKQKVFRDIKRLKDIRSYRGLRHRLGLPSRGQKTRTNAVTRKGKNIAIGGLNPKVTKK